MDAVSQPRGDPLASPLGAELFDALVALRRPASTQELATRLGRHHNTVRVQLGRLCAAGLLERRVVGQPRGRPRHDWAVAASAAPGGQAPEGYVALGRWLARAIGRGGGIGAIEATGEEIGHELAPSAGQRPTAEVLHDVLAALGFAPTAHADVAGGVRYVLGNCPYRQAVRENQAAVCALHRGITAGLLGDLDGGARLTRFVPHDPETAGCEIEVALSPAGG